MTVTRPQPSTSATIPRGFHFHYRDGQPPKTPEPDDQSSREPLSPPPPPRQPLRRTTRRLGIPPFSPPRGSVHLPPDFVLPTIEHPTPEPVPMTGMQFLHAPNLKFLAPQPLGQNVAFSPPKTPMAQLKRAEPLDHFDCKNTGDSVSRPSTAGSTFSDSSLSSQESLESFPSFGACSVSPESESQDPFVTSMTDSQELLVSPPMTSYQGPPRKRLRVVKKTVWTKEMDHHLWMAFLNYLNDPSHTPFKLFPGWYPPLGVCSRVANDAKHTWRTNRGNFESHLRLRTGSPDTIRAAGSGETTPTGIEVRRPVQPWPRNSATRRRLRILSKGEPELSAHYQRMMLTRSPSPFESSSSSRGRSGSQASPFTRRSPRSAFSTRDMNFSLVTTTSSAMQAGNPLSALTADDFPARLPDLPPQSPISRSGTHQRSHSLQLGIEALAPSSDFHILASPFHPRPYATWHARRWAAPSQLSPDAMDMSPKLEPAAELHPPAPMSRSLKKRARMHLDDRSSAGEGRENLLTDFFGVPAESSHRRVRNRGFSLDDMTDGARRLSSVFTPPSADKALKSNVGPSDSNLPSLSTSRPQRPSQLSGLGINCMLAPPQLDAPPRLGSPFAYNQQDRHFHTIPRNFKMNLDAGSAFELPSSFEDRLSALAPGRVSKVSGSRSLGRNFARNNPAVARLLREQDQ